jgi:Zn-dependent protease
MQFGFKVNDIILTPIGGMARIESMGMKPLQEAWMAIAGPLVSLVLAIISGISYALLFQIPPDVALGGDNFPATLLAWSTAFNTVLLLFNLVPAFPMDGGRVLRALLGLKWPLVPATRIAVQISRAICVVFMLLGVFPSILFPHGNPSLLFIGIAIFWLSGAELRQAKKMEKLQAFQQMARENMVIVSPPPYKDAPAHHITIEPDSR